MRYTDIQLDVEAGVATLAFNSPETRNAMSAKLQEESIHALHRLHDDRAVRVVIITGAGDGAFSAGGDLRQIAHTNGNTTDSPSPPAPRGYDRRQDVKQLQRMILAIRGCEKPVLAAVNGAAVGGGCDLALACDIRIASDRAVFGEVFARIGLFPGTGGTYLLPRIVGIAKALELIWTGDVIDAAEAQKIGLVETVVPHAELMPTVNAFTRRLADGPPLAQSLSKAAVYHGLDVDLAAALEYTATAEVLTLESQDHREGVAAFMEKRKPTFGGR